MVMVKGKASTKAEFESSMTEGAKCVRMRKTEALCWLRPKERKGKERKQQAHSLAAAWRVYSRSQTGRWSGVLSLHPLG